MCLILQFAPRQSGAARPIATAEISKLIALHVGNLSRLVRPIRRALGGVLGPLSSEASGGVRSPLWSVAVALL